MGMTMTAAKNMYEPILKAQILRAMQDGLKATFGPTQNELSDAMALKFAQQVADELSGPICDTIVNIVKEAMITGPGPIVSTIITPGFGAPATGVLPFIGTELSLQ